MSTALRAVVTLVALASIALAGAASVQAADPTQAPSAPVIGGDLEAFTKRVVLTSRSTFPVAVTMVAEGPFTLTPDSFNLAPGETVTMSIDGDPAGRISAVMHALTAAPGDTASVTLQVAFPEPAPVDWLSVAFWIAAAALVAALLLRWAVRARLWELRLRRPA